MKRAADSGSSNPLRIAMARKRAAAALNLVKEDRWQEALDVVKDYGARGDEAWLTNLSARILMSEHLMDILAAFEKACTKLDTPRGSQARTGNENLDQTGA